MRRITLVRHGRPECDPSIWIRGAGFAAWWAAYDRAGVVAASEPPPALGQTLRGCDLLVTSTLRRAQASLERLVPGAEPRVDSCFCEIPIPALDVPALRLPAGAWSVAGRTAWLAGLVEGPESRSQARARVRRAARLLEHWSLEHSHVGVVAHGFFNGWLGLALRGLGWRGGELGTPTHWASATWTRDAGDPG